MGWKYCNPGQTEKGEGEIEWLLKAHESFFFECGRDLKSQVAQSKEQFVIRSGIDLTANCVLFRDHVMRGICESGRDGRSVPLVPPSRDEPLAMAVSYK